MTSLKTKKIYRKLRLLVPHREVPVVLYHHIGQAPRDMEPLSLYYVETKVFDRQMHLLKEAGLRAISLDELVTARNEGCQDLSRTFVLTFDDGYLDNFTNAFPILLKYGLKATIFLVSDYVGSRMESSSEPLMTWQQGREMSQHGISFQSHTCTHPDLTILDDRRVLNELIDSKKKIEDALSAPVRHFAYPYGRYDRRIAQLVKQAGYKSAYGGEWDKGRFSWPRLECYSSDTVAGFRLKASAWGVWHSRLQEILERIGVRRT